MNILTATMDTSIPEATTNSEGTTISNKKAGMNTNMA